MTDKSFHKMALEAPHKLVRGFLAGVMAASGKPVEIIYCRDREIESRSVGRQLTDWMGVSNNETHVVVSAEQRDEIRSAMKRLPEGFPFGVNAENQIASASFEFEFEAFAPQYGKKILEIFENPGAGITLAGYQPSEKYDKEGEGIESYAPLHHYEASGKGKAVGPIDSILELHQKCLRTDLVEESEIELNLD